MVKLSKIEKKSYLWDDNSSLYTHMTNTTANILIIEDHAVVQLGIHTLLSTCSRVNLIDRASTGAEALRKVQENSFDMVLVDVELPDMSGFELLEFLRKYQPMMKVVFYSMHNEFWVVRQMLKSEADGIVMKSDCLDELRMAVEIVIDGGKYYSKEYGLFLKDYESQEELSPQELKVLRFVADGLTSQQIAGNMFVSVNTVEFHRRRIMRKLGVANMAELIKKAIEKGFIRNRY